MTKTRRERRAEAIKAIKKAVEDRGNYIDVFEVIDELYEIDYYDCTNAEDIEILLDLLSEDECHIEERCGDWYCSACNEMVGTCDTASELYVDGNAVAMWSYCPRCGAKVRTTND